MWNLFKTSASLLKIEVMVFTVVGLATIGCSDSVQVFGTISPKSESVAGPNSSTSCTDNALNTAQCSTAANRYVTSTLGSNFTATATNPTQSTSISVPIPTTGFYTAGITAIASDTNLLASNIVSGVTIFGVTGTTAGSLAACTSNGQSGCAANASYLAGAPASLNTNATNAALVITPPAGYYNGTTKTVTANDTNLIAANIASGVNIFGTTGTVSEATFLGSGASRDAAAIPAAFAGVLGGSGANYTAGVGTSLQLTHATEEATYGQAGGGALLPSTGGYNYRDIPDGAKDSEGINGTDIAYALRPTVDCGATGTIATRVTNCAGLNSTRASWNGATNGNSGQSTWNLVSRTGANKEVWQDTRTGLIWSSKASTTPNWCQASGNIQYAPVTFQQSFHTSAGTVITGNGTISSITGGSSSIAETITIGFTSSTAFTVSGSCGGGGITGGGLTGVTGSTVTYGRANYCSFTLTQGSTTFASGDTFTLQSNDSSSFSCYPNGASGLQPTNYISYCSEQTGYYPGFAGDSYTSGWANASYTYDAAKGGMGRTSTYPVYWRLPTLNDSEIAQVDGLRFVMPDIGAVGSSRALQDSSTGLVGFEWTATVYSLTRFYSWYTQNAIVRNSSRIGTYGVRCVGR